MNPQRKSSITKHIAQLLPGVPFIDAQEICNMATSAHMRSLSASAAVRLAAVAYIRHRYTDYDELRDSGYDHDSARFFIAQNIKEKLIEWRANFTLNTDE